MKRVFIVAAALAAVVCFAGLGLRAYYRDALNRKPVPPTATTVVIPPGYTTQQIAALLAREGVIANARIFVWYCRFNRLDGKLEAGRYYLKSADGTPAIARTLAAGRVFVHKFTVPEGYDKYKTAARVARTGICTEREFLAAGDRGDPEGRVAGKDLEGYLFPDTYEVASDADADAVVAMMLARFFQVMGPAERRRAEEEGRSLAEVVTLASIVEREAMKKEEKPLVASVFYNRLARGMRLESCATVIYALGRQTDRLTVQDLKVESPYNTYIHEGLPPGPICSPGEDSLRAALEPARTDYLFFVSNGDGTHTFTTNLRDHLNARSETKERGRK